jgi:transposase InsO family protein
VTTSKSSRRRGKEQREARKRGEEQRRQYTEKEREHALTLVVSGMARTDVAAAIGCSTESIRLWYRKAEAEGRLPVVEGTARTAAVARDAEVGDDEDRAEEAVAGEPVEESAVVPANASPSARSIYAPRDPGQGLAEYEVEKILEYKRRHPSMEPAQLRAQLKRFEGWRLSIKAIARVLKQHGYQLVHRGSRPTGPEPVRFEAPRRNALWQLDFTELHVEGLRLHLLVVLDDFSRFVVGHVLAGACSSDVVVATLGAAIARHGKPEAVRTDRGGAFLSGELGSYLEAELIDHVVGRPYHPQGGGKVESIIGTVRRELWDVEHFEDRAAAERRLACFFEEYNGGSRCFTSLCGWNIKGHLLRGRYCGSPAGVGKVREPGEHFGGVESGTIEHPRPARHWMFRFDVSTLCGLAKSPRVHTEMLGGPCQIHPSARLLSLKCVSRDLAFAA